MESILTSIKKLLGIEDTYTHFDVDITIHINSVLATLNQLGVGPEDGFVVVDKAQTWKDYLGDRKDIESVKSYIYMRVRLIFDPPQMGYLVTAIKQQCDEFEWRLNVKVEGDRTQ